MAEKTTAQTEDVVTQTPEQEAEHDRRAKESEERMAKRRPAEEPATEPATEPAHARPKHSARR